MQDLEKVCYDAELFRAEQWFNESMEGDGDEWPDPSDWDGEEDG